MSYYSEVLEHITTTQGLSRDGLLKALCADAIPAQTGGEGNWGNIFIRPMEFAEAGAVVEGHVHQFDHVTFINAGTLLFCSAEKPVMTDCAWCDGNDKNCKVCRGKGHYIPPPNYGTEKTYGDGNFLLIPAGRVHRFVCVSASARAYCVFSHRDPETGAVVNTANGWTPAYS